MLKILRREGNKLEHFPDTGFAGNRWWLLWSIVMSGVYLRGLSLDVMDVDAAQYASIAMEMAQNGSWLQVMHRGGDYLDKPPLLFWLSAFSFKIFGFSNWAYKLPSVLIEILGIYSIYRFTRLFYGLQTALNAALILTGSIGILLIANDIRTDTLLLGFTACSIWLLAEYLETGRWYWWPLAFIAIGLAMLAKGPIGLVMPAFAVGTHLALSRNWHSIFKWQWLVGLMIIALVLSPMAWGLYQQFDLHPEKQTNGQIGVSGLYFFFWEQSFGRITGENVWKNNAPWFYFIHVYLWAFLPWAFILIGAIFNRVKNLISSRFRLANFEGYSLGAFFLTFVALSLSKYKLPHYIFVTLPWAAVLTASFLNQNIFAKNRVLWWFLQHTAAFLALITSWALLIWVFPQPDFFILAISVVLTALLILHAIRSWKSGSSRDFIKHGLLTVLLCGIVLNFHFYPRLLPYQSTATAARWAIQRGIPTEQLAFFNRHGHTYDFYSSTITRGFSTAEAVKQASEKSEFWLYTNAEGKKKIDNAGVNYSETAEFQHFQAALLNLKFINPATRMDAVKPVFMLKISKNTNN